MAEKGDAGDGMHEGAEVVGCTSNVHSSKGPLISTAVLCVTCSIVLATSWDRLRALRKGTSYRYM